MSRKKKHRKKKQPSLRPADIAEGLFVVQQVESSTGPYSRVWQVNIMTTDAPIPAFSSPVTKETAEDFARGWRGAFAGLLQLTGRAFGRVDEMEASRWLTILHKLGLLRIAAAWASSWARVADRGFPAGKRKEGRQQ